MLVPDVKVFPRENNFLIFSPLTKTISYVNLDLLTLLKANLNDLSNLTSENKELLIAAGLISDKIVIPHYELQSPFKPTKVTLFPTSNCNLRCTYCYATAGELEIANMEERTAKGSIDFIVNNAIETKTNQVMLGFHGGGEPTYRWNLFTSIINYAKKVCTEKDLSLWVAL
jgi:biotin synthase-like enzyme